MTEKRESKKPRRRRGPKVERLELTREAIQELTEVEAEAAKAGFACCGTSAYNESIVSARQA